MSVVEHLGVREENFVLAADANIIVPRHILCEQHGDDSRNAPRRTRIAAQNLAEEQPSRLVQWLFYSHPPIRERIAAAQAYKA